MQDHYAGRGLAMLLFRAFGPIYLLADEGLNDPDPFLELIVRRIQGDHMVVSQHKGTLIYTPIYYNPSYRDHPKGTPNFGKPPYQNPTGK